jgi:hypothetical protein
MSVDLHDVSGFVLTRTNPHIPEKFMMNSYNAMKHLEYLLTLL